MSHETKRCRLEDCPNWLTEEQYSKRLAYCSEECRKVERRAQMAAAMRRQRRRKREEEISK